MKPSQHCAAYRQQDQYACPKCGLIWDANDPEPPQCGRPRPVQRALITNDKCSVPGCAVCTSPDHKPSFVSGLPEKVTSRRTRAGLWVTPTRIAQRPARDPEFDDGQWNDWPAED